MRQNFVVYRAGKNSKFEYWCGMGSFCSDIKYAALFSTIECAVSVRSRFSTASIKPYDENTTIEVDYVEYNASPRSFRNPRVSRRIGLAQQ